MPRIFAKNPITVRDDFTYLKISPDQLDWIVMVEVPCSSHKTQLPVLPFDKAEVAKKEKQVTGLESNGIDQV